MNAINKFSRLKTIIIIAHRTNTLKKCDNIFIFDQGRVIDSGNFKSLFENLSKNSQYLKLLKYNYYYRFNSNFIIFAIDSKVIINNQSYE